MDQNRIGAFLKMLRKEKNLTQEQLADQLNVSGRTVSRWETGSNMPDISLLVELSEFYDVSIPELIDGERKSGEMKEEAKEVAGKMSEYADNEKTQMLKNIRRESLIGAIAAAVWMVLEGTGLSASGEVFPRVSLYCETLVFVTVFMIFFHATGLMNRYQKKRGERRIQGPLLMVLSAVLALAAAVLIKLVLKTLFGG